MHKLLKISLALIAFFGGPMAVAKEPVWVGTKSELASAVAVGSNVELAKKPKKGRLNLRATAQAKEIEVYNWNKAEWIGSAVLVDERINLNRHVVNSLTNLSECDHIADVFFEIRESTPSSDIYADGFSKGQTDSNGMYKQKVRTVCLNDNCRFELKKNNCESATDSFPVTSNPFTYSYSKKLNCK